MKRLLKWFAVFLLLAFGVFLVIFFSREAILKKVVIANIRQQTGLAAEIGKFHVGVREPVIQITDFKLMNPPDFGGAPLLVIRELFVEFDKDLLVQSNRLHITRARFHLSELDIVKNAAGKTNLLELGLAMPSKDDLKKDGGLKELKARTGIDFGGVDELEVSVGTMKFLDLQNPQNNREQNLAIEHQKLNNIRSEADLSGLILLLTLRGGGFFSDVFGADVLKNLQ